MQKLKIIKELEKEDYIDTYFEMLNKLVLTKPLSKKKLEVTKALYKIKNKYSDINCTEARKDIEGMTKVTQANLSTYLKELKEIKILTPFKEGYVFNSQIGISAKEIEFTFIIKLKR
jgi:Fic family protein